MILHACRTIGTAGAIAMHPDFFPGVFFLGYEDMRHIVEQFTFGIASKYAFDGLRDMVGDDGPVGVREIGTGLAGGHIELAILAVSIKGDEWFLPTKVGCADFGRDRSDSLLERGAPEETSDIHENGR